MKRELERDAFTGILHVEGLEAGNRAFRLCPYCIETSDHCLLKSQQRLDSSDRNCSVKNVITELIFG